MKNILFLTFAPIILLTVIFSHSALAQKTETIEAGKDGKIHLAKSLKLGDKTLAAGMYQVQHLTAGEDHIIVFKEVGMENMGGMDMSKEAARIKSAVEPLDKSAAATKLLITADSAGERWAAEVWIKGEKLKHVLPTR